MQKGFTHAPKLSWNEDLVSGFTLVEMILVVAIIAILILIVIAAINPIEQLHKAEDTSNENNARELLNAVERYQTIGVNPLVKNFANSYVCEDIIDAGPVVEIASLKDELSDWFPKRIMEKGTELYLGLITGTAKVCYQVKSIRNMELARTDGCQTGFIHYLCLPR